MAMGTKPPDNAQREVLSGWKDIAHYLGKAVRTLQRYEHQLGLPVRRPLGHRTSAVVAMKSELDSWVKSSPIGQKHFDASQQATQTYLISELAGRLQERAVLHAQMMALRKELKATVLTIRESIAELRQQLKETQKRQDVIESVIRSNARHLVVVDVKHRKPN